MRTWKVEVNAEQAASLRVWWHRDNGRRGRGS
jgi:hypothetical protein